MAKQKEIREVNECVIFIHGLGRTPRSFRRMRKEIDAKGFTTINISYPSTKHCIEELLERIRPQIQNAFVESFDKVHFVVHSLGGIMLRLFLSRYKLKNLGRVVMLGTPNQGSRLADSLSKSKICRAFCGPALSELGTGSESIIHKFGIVDFELGVIAGTRSLNPIFSFIIGDECDGKVSVKETYVQNMSDFLTVKRSHTFMMCTSDVIEYTINFLNFGVFIGQGRRPETTGKLSEEIVNAS